MKKLLAAAVLGVLSLTVWVGNASAGIFNKCCNQCGTFCVRPYNAFSPVCYGSVTCVGCNPLATPGYGPNLAFHGAVCGPHSMYGHGTVPVMSSPMPLPTGPMGSEMLPTPSPAPLPSDVKPGDEKKAPDGKSAMAPAPYGMTPWGVPVWATGNPNMMNPYAYRMPQAMPPQMPYGQMPQMPYGQMPYGQMPQMPYGQMPQAMPNYGWNGYMPNMMNPGMGAPGMGAPGMGNPGMMQPTMPNAR